MSASEHPLWRGIDEGSGGSFIRDITKRNLGIHWTDHPETADRFAQPHKFDEETREPISHPALSDTQFGTVIHAKVPAKNTVKEGSPECNKLADKHHIYGHEAEEEVTVRPNATVKVHALERKISTPEGKERTRIVRFNPPREMKA